MPDTNEYPPQTLAIVGMSGRFPGARSIDQYWANLLAGVESLSRLTREQLVEAGVEAFVAALRPGTGSGARPRPLRRRLLRFQPA